MINRITVEPADAVVQRYAGKELHACMLVPLLQQLDYRRDRIIVVLEEDSAHAGRCRIFDGFDVIEPSPHDRWTTVAVHLDCAAKDLIHLLLATRPGNGSRRAVDRHCLLLGSCHIKWLGHVPMRVTQSRFTSPRRGEVGMGAPCAQFRVRGTRSTHWRGTPSPGSRERDPTSPLRGEVTPPSSDANE